MSIFMFLIIIIIINNSSVKNKIIDNKYVSTRLHGVISRKIVLFRLTAVITSNITFIILNCKFSVKGKGEIIPVQAVEALRVASD
jgi:hypothetical protein